MKKLLLSFLVIVISIQAGISQQVINDANAQERTVGSFHAIEVATGIQLTLTQGNSEEVAVSATSGEFRDKIVTKVDNGVLKIYYEDKLSSMNTKRQRKDLKAYVSCKTLDRLEANTGGTVDIIGTLKAGSLTMHANTGGTITGMITSSSLKVDQNTGSVITLSGNTENLDVEGSTGSRFKGVELTTAVCNAQVSTGASVTITAQKELSVKASTGGDVKYKGDASLKDIKKGTGGSVTKI